MTPGHALGWCQDGYVAFPPDQIFAGRQSGAEYFGAFAERDNFSLRNNHNAPLLPSQGALGKGERNDFTDSNMVLLPDRK